MGREYGYCQEHLLVLLLTTIFYFSLENRFPHEPGPCAYGGLEPIINSRDEEVT